MLSTNIVPITLNITDIRSYYQDEIQNPNDKLHNFTEKHLYQKLVGYLLKGTIYIPCPSKQCNINAVRSNLFKSLKNLIHKEAIKQGFWLDINNYSVIDLLYPTASGIMFVTL